MPSRLTAAKKRPPAKHPAPPPAGPPPVPAPAPGRTEVGGVLTLAEIRRSPLNIRKRFDPADVAGLAENIRAAGLLQRLLVRPMPVLPPGSPPRFDGRAWSGVEWFELVDGERRHRALCLNAEEHGIEAPVPVVVREMTDEEALAAMVATREQSRDVLPSELVAGYAGLGRGKTDEQLAALVGRPVGHVRGIRRLAKLPPWALSAVDRGDLPRATAELVARVPGEESRKRAAACVLLGVHAPHFVADADLADLERGGPTEGIDPDEVLSYRGTKELIARHLQTELKTAPFSRKSLTLLPEAGSCDACPSRAGNDPDAVAEKVRADMCLNPDCYREKVRAHDAAELERGLKRGAAPAPAEFAWGFAGGVPKGWCDAEQVGGGVDLQQDLAGVRGVGGKTLAELLKLDTKALGGDTPVYAALDPARKLRLLVKTADARRALQKAGVLRKPDPRPKPAKRVPLGDEEVTLTGTPAAPADPRPPLADEYAVDERAAEIAAKVLGEFVEMNTDDLDAITTLTGDHWDTSCVFDAVRWLVRYLIRDHHDFGPERWRHVAAALALPAGPRDEKAAVAAAERLTPRRLFGLAVRLAAAPVLEAEGGAKTGFAAEILEWAELDWGQLRDQARRELAGGETVDAKPAAEKCRVCGCVEADCSGCIARTGQPCSWADATHTLCTACESLAAADIGILFCGRHGVGDNGRMQRLSAAKFNTVGQVLLLDPANPPDGLKAEDVEAVKGAAAAWCKEQLDGMSPEPAAAEEKPAPEAKPKKKGKVSA